MKFYLFYFILLSFILFQFLSHFFFFKLQYLQRNSKYCGELFSVLYEFALIGKAEREFLLKKGVLGILIEFLMETGPFSTNSSPLFGSRYSSNNEAPLFALITLLVRSTKTQKEKDAIRELQREKDREKEREKESNKQQKSRANSKSQGKSEIQQQQQQHSEKPDHPPTQFDDLFFELPMLEHELVLQKSFLMKFVKECNNPENVAQLFAHYAWENERLTKHLISVIREGLNRGATDTFVPWFSLLTSFLSINDSLQEWRVDNLMCWQISLIASNIARRGIIDTYVKYLEHLSFVNNNVHLWIRANQNSIDKLLVEAGWTLG